jgi:transposase
MQRPTQKELHAIYNLGPETTITLLNSLFDKLESFEQQVTNLQTRMKSLEDKLAKDSHNSSKPPSTDGLKKKTKSLRQQGQNPVGGQKCHQGQTLKRVENPDNTEIVTAPAYCRCGQCLAGTTARDYQSRQVFDIPPAEIQVTEYKAEIKICPQCQRQVKASFPAHVTQPVQYGPRLKAQVAYLMNQHLLPYERTAEVIEDFYGHKISTGTLYNINKACSEILEASVLAIKKKIITSAVAHFDETSLRVSKNNKHWLHTASTPTHTFYHINKKRGSEAIDKMGILAAFEGTAVHDHFKAYLKYKCKHALCNAHHLRELIFLFEQHKQKWAGKMITLLLKIKKATDQAKNKGHPVLDKNQIEQFEKIYLEILKQGFKDNPDYDPRRKRKKRSAAQNLLIRLRDFKEQTLAFMHDFQIPFDNNLAERDIRMMKLHQKISGCFRAKQGAEIFCQIRSFLSTARKQNHNRFYALYQAFQDNSIELA